MCDNIALSNDMIDEMFIDQSTRTVEEIKKDLHFLSLAESYLNMLTQHNNRLDEFISKYGDSFEKFRIELNELFDDIKALIKSEHDIEKMGYNLFDVCKAQNAELLQKTEKTT